MRSLLPVLIAAALVAALPASAPAKGITSAEVCGAAGCQDVDAAQYYALYAEGDPTQPPAAAAPFVTVKFTQQHGPDYQARTPTTTCRASASRGPSFQPSTASGSS